MRNRGLFVGAKAGRSKRIGEHANSKCPCFRRRGLGAPARSTEQQPRQGQFPSETDAPFSAALRSSLRFAVLLNMDAGYDAEPQHFGKFPVSDLVASWKCYCSLHGYSFFLDHTRYPHLDGRPNTNHIASTRISAVLTYLNNYDYVVPVSLDTVVVNRSYRLEEFIHGRPDVVVALRSHVWQWGRVRDEDFGDYYTDVWWPKRMFPGRPKRMPHPPMLHTEVLFVKNSVHGREFVINVLRHADLFNALDMCAIQQAALEFVHPETHSVHAAKRFSESLQFGQCANLSEYLGYRKAWCSDFRYPPPAKLMYYKMSTDALAEARDWFNQGGGHLRIAAEAEFLRDWSHGPLMRGGDFIVHTKIFFDDRLAEGLGRHCAEADSIPMVPHPDMFADRRESHLIAVGNGYDLHTTFEKRSQRV